MQTRPRKQTWRFRQRRRGCNAGSSNDSSGRSGRAQGRRKVRVRGRDRAKCRDRGRDRKGQQQGRGRGQGRGGGWGAAAGAAARAAVAAPNLYDSLPEERLAFCLGDGRGGVLSVRGRRVQDTHAQRPLSLMQVREAGEDALERVRKGGGASRTVEPVYEWWAVGAWAAGATRACTAPAVSDAG